VGAILVFRIPLAVERVTDQPGDASLLVYGLVLLLSVHFVPRGLMSGWWYLRDRIAQSGSKPADEVAPDADPAAVSEAVISLLDRERPDGSELRITDVVKKLGGVTAVGGIDLTVRAG